MRVGHLITVSGIDCAGKTTQLRMLREALEKRGQQRVRLFWFRPGYSDELDQLRRFVRRLRPELLPTASDPAARERAFSRGTVRSSWLYLALLDTCFQYCVKLRILRLTSDAVLCDRYLADATLDLELRFPERAREARRFLAIIRHLCPAPDRAVLLNLPKEEMLRRMAEKQEPFPDAADVRTRRYDAYQRMVRSEPWTVVDATQSREQVHEQILSILPD